MSVRRPDSTETASTLQASKPVKERTTVEGRGTCNGLRMIGLASEVLA